MLKRFFNVNGKWPGILFFVTTTTVAAIAVADVSLWFSAIAVGMGVFAYFTPPGK